MEGCKDDSECILCQFICLSKLNVKSGDFFVISYHQSSSLSTAGNTTEVEMSNRFCDPKKDIDEEEEEREEEMSAVRESVRRP